MQTGEGKKALAKQTASCERLYFKDKAAISVFLLSLILCLEEFAGFTFCH